MGEALDLQGEVVFLVLVSQLEAIPVGHGFKWELWGNSAVGSDVVSQHREMG